MIGYRRLINSNDNVPPIAPPVQAEGLPIPEAILKERRRILRRRLIFTIPTTVAAILLLSFFNEEILGAGTDIFFRVPVSILLCFVPAIVSGLWRYLFDRTFIGVIVKVETEKKMQINRGRALAWGAHIRAAASFSYVFWYYLRVQLPNGKIRRLKVAQQVEGKPANVKIFYREGDTIGHLKGASHFFSAYLIESERSDITICLRCGTVSPSENEKCHYCNAPLVKPRQRKKPSVTRLIRRVGGVDIELREMRKDGEQVTAAPLAESTPSSAENTYTPPAD